MSGNQFANIRNFSLILLFSSSLIACGGGEKGGKDSQKDGDEKELQKDSSKAKAEKQSMNKSPVLPSTLQVAASFQKAGLPYKEGLIMSPGKAENFMEGDRKNLAFGAYSADLAYLVLNGEAERARKVMDVLMGLSEDLGISSVFDMEGIAERFRSNMEKKDSLVDLLMEIQQKFDTYVAKNRNSELRIIAYAGGWTEAIHLASHSGIGDKKELHTKVEEQMRILRKLLKAMNMHLKESEGSVAKLQKELKAMSKTYQDAKPAKGEPIPDSLMKDLKEHAKKARKIISNPGS